jgi:hypothetical protein
MKIILSDDDDVDDLHSVIAALLFLTRVFSTLLQGCFAVFLKPSAFASL